MGPMTERGTTGVGARLKGLREGKRVTLRQIAASTKISVPSLEAIERDDVRKLPGGIFGRSFVRSYARELGLKASVRVADERLRLELSATDRASLPETVLLTIAHPTRDGRDQVLRLSGPGGVFEAAIAPLGAGRWLFQIEDADGRSWKLNGAARLPAEAAFAIDSSAR